MNSFFSLKVGSRKGKAIVSRQKLVNRDKKIVVVIAALAAGVLTFSLSIGQRLLDINTSNSEAISGLNIVSDQVDTNIEAEKDLRQSYEEFNNQRNNRDWSRRSLACLTSCQNKDVEPVLTVLDALPSRYDSLAMRHQLQSFFDRHQFRPQNIEVPHADSVKGGDGSYIEVPVEISLEAGDLDEVLRFINLLDNSIRPMVIDQMSVSRSSGSDKWSLRVSFTTYYQPEIELEFAKVLIDQPNTSAPAPATEDEQ